MCFTFFFFFANENLRERMLSDALNTPWQRQHHAVGMHFYWKVKMRFSKSMRSTKDLRLLKWFNFQQEVKPLAV